MRCRSSPTSSSFLVPLQSRRRGTRRGRREKNAIALASQVRIVSPLQNIRNCHTRSRKLFFLETLRMEQESWKMEKDETGCQPPEGPILCSNNCGFFGSAATMNLCSQCYRDVVLKQAKAAKAASAISAVHSEESVPEIGRQLQPEVAASDTGSSSQSVATEGSGAAASSEQLPRQSNRCFSCKKRVGLTGFKCRCGNQFCSLHRYHDKHNCSFDYRAAAREAIAKANPVVKADKIDKI